MGPAHTATCLCAPIKTAFRANSLLDMDVEDILNDALSSVLDGPPRADPNEEGVVRYGPLVLRVAPKVDLPDAQ
jgi:hypothetical protein